MYTLFAGVCASAQLFPIYHCHGGDGVVPLGQASLYSSINVTAIEELTKPSSCHLFIPIRSILAQKHTDRHSPQDAAECMRAAERAKPKKKSIKSESSPHKMEVKSGRSLIYRYERPQVKIFKR